MTGPGLLQGREQYRKRQAMTWHDQYDRRFDLEIDLDLETMSWVGPPLLLDCVPPVDLPQVFVKPILNKQGRVEMGRIYCDFSGWRNEQLRQESRWRQSLRDRAEMMYPHSSGEMLENPPLDLLIEVGPGPVPSDYIQACIAGNKWALGKRQLTGAPYPTPPWVTPAMLARIAALSRTTGYREDAVLGENTTTIDDYPDAPEDEIFHTSTDDDAFGGKTVKMRKKSLPSDL